LNLKIELETDAEQLSLSMQIGVKTGCRTL